MFLLQAPYPSIQSSVVLPSPKWGDSVGLVSTLQILRTMNGTRYTYVHSKDGRKTLQWDFTISRHKAFELRAFITAYHSYKIVVTDHNDDKWYGYLINNPFEYAGSVKAVNFPGEETMDITLEFEEAE
jgi:hypothetical protein